MARQARLCSPGHAHLVQLQAAAGVQPLAAAPQRDRFLRWMSEALEVAAVRLHAYALLPQAVWLLLTPGSAPDLSSFVQGLARRTSRAQQGAVLGAGAPPIPARTPVWAGRFRSTVVQPGEWELTAMIWIDRAAEHAEGIAAASAWPWSSRAAHCGETLVGAPSAALSLPTAYWALGNTPFEREAAYRRRLQQGLNAASLLALHSGLRRGTAIGDAAFLLQLEAASGRRVLPGQRGRPRMKIA